MKALIIYDSVFGNTEQLAQAIAGVLASAGEVEAKRAGEVSRSDLDGVDLLVVGSPTRKFSATPETTRFLKGLAPDALQRVRVAAFDTRVDIAASNNRFLSLLVKLFGYAAEPIAKQLEKKGGERAADPAGFFVGGTEGPITEGERGRAEEWARSLVEQ
ncbi:MAG: flavodoxin family protein [Spirochaetota bacterium]